MGNVSTADPNEGMFDRVDRTLEILQVLHLLEEEWLKRPGLTLQEIVVQLRLNDAK